MSAASLTALGTDASTGCTARTTGRVSWVTVVVCASVIAYIDGFWNTSLHGAVGSVDSTQGPFLSWLRDSTLMVPPFVLAVLAALTLTRRWVGRSRREGVRLATAAMLMVVICSAVGIAEVTISSVSDYRVQAAQLGASHSTHATSPIIEPRSAEPPSAATCTALCAARHQTLVAHVRAVGYASVVLFITNVVLVAWVLALRGGRLWAEAVRCPHRVSAARPG